MIWGQNQWPSVEYLQYVKQKYIILGISTISLSFSHVFLDTHRRFYSYSFISMFYFHLVFGRLALSMEIISWEAWKLNRTIAENQQSKE